MKLLYRITLSVFIAATVLTSCIREQFDNVFIDTPAKHFNANGKAYLKMTIKMPSNRGTKVDAYDDGLENEYKVHDATLVLFSASATTTEGNYAIRSAYNITEAFVADGQNNQITSVSNVVREVSQIGIGENDNVKAFVILNSNNIFTVDGTSLKVNASGVAKYEKGTFTPVAVGTDLTGYTFTEFLKLTQHGSTYSPNAIFSFIENGFLMFNSPLSNKGRGHASDADVQVTTLADINPNAVYESRAAALNGNAASEVFVERAVAKVTVRDGNNGEKSVTGTNLTYELKSWIIDATARDTYLTRNVGNYEWLPYKSGKDGSYERFLDLAPVSSSVEKYRVNWAIDPTYYYHENDKPTLSEHFNYVNASGVSGSLSSPQYCYENTFEVKRMRDNQATRVIFAVQLKKEGSDLGDFYTSSALPNHIFETEDALKEHIKDLIMSISYTRDFIVQYAQEGAENVTFDDLFRSITTTYNSVTGNVSLSLEPIFPLVNREGVVWKDTHQYPNIVMRDNLKRELGTLRFSKYTGGVAYYPVYIRHFDDDETPWKQGEHTSYPVAYPKSTSNLRIRPFEIEDEEEDETPDESGDEETTDESGDEETTGESGDNTPVSDRDYLGRYGIVRNHWYDISVDSVLGLGSPTVPSIEITGSPTNGSDGSEYIDKLEKYVKVKINILSWKKRTQSALIK